MRAQDRGLGQVQNSMASVVLARREGRSGGVRESVAALCALVRPPADCPSGGEEGLGAWREEQGERGFTRGPKTSPEFFPEIFPK